METMSRQEATPSAIVTAEDLLKKLRAGVQEVYTVKVRDVEIPMRPLSNAEAVLIRREAIKAAAAVGGDETEKNIVIQRLTLTYATQDPVKKLPFVSPKFWEIISVDEIQNFYKEYALIMDNVNPSLETLNPDQFRALVEALKKSAISVKELSLLQLKTICTAFVELIQRQALAESQTDNTSGGQP